jgi:hypothetical protein
MLEQLFGIACSALSLVAIFFGILALGAWISRDSGDGDSGGDWTPGC